MSRTIEATERKQVRMPDIDKVVVVTGASSGIGESTARLLARHGAKVVLGARRKDRLDAAAKEISAAGGKAISVAVDVTKRAEVEALIRAAVDSFGRVDVMVNDAGIMAIVPIEALKVEEWDRMIDVNIKGLLYGVAAVLPQMLKQKSGHIINLASVFGIKVFAPGGTVYCATKSAVRALTEGLRIELFQRQLGVADHLREEQRPGPRNDLLHGVAASAEGHPATVAELVCEIVETATHNGPDPGRAAQAGQRVEEVGVTAALRHQDRRPEPAEAGRR